MMYSKKQEQADLELRSAALNGNANALGELIEQHRDFIYNVVWRMVMNPQDAEDITQDVIIKVITNLAQFKGKSKLSTWIYRIAFNHVINLPKRPMEMAISGFEKYGEDLDNTPDHQFPTDGQPTAEDRMIIDDVMMGCTTGMLMCLTREQRLIYILGDMFEINSDVASQIVDTTKDNFRQQLSRARKQLYNFMDHKCGLINKSNPCRCQKKTKSFIEAGWVDPKNLKFNTSYRKRIKESANIKHKEMDEVVDKGYATIFREHPFQQKDELKKRVEKVILGKEFKKTFNLNNPL